MSLVEDYWKDETTQAKEAIKEFSREYMVKPVSELTPEEILQEFRDAVERNSETTKDFIILWIGMDTREGKDYSNDKSEFPEYFL